MDAVDYVIPADADRGRDHGKPGSHVLRNLEARAASRKHRIHGHVRDGQQHVLDVVLDAAAQEHVGGNLPAGKVVRRGADDQEHDALVGRGELAHDEFHRFDVRDVAAAEKHGDRSALEEARDGRQIGVRGFRFACRRRSG